MLLLVACPPESVTGEPKLVPSIVNWTVPVGVPVAGDTALTCATKLTLWLKIEGLSVESTLVVLAAWFTVKVPSMRVAMT